MRCQSLVIDREKVLKILFISLALLLYGAILASAEPAHAADSRRTQTLFQSEDLEFGGFGGPTAYYTTFNGEPGLLVGGHGGLVVNRSFWIGAGGMGLTSNHDGPPAPTPYQNSRLRMGYGGLMLGYIHNGDNLLHLAGDVLIGGGGLVNTYEDEHGDEVHDDQEDFENDVFFVVQPMLRVEANVTNWLRVNASAGYRLVSGIDRFGLDSADASGPVAGLSFHFGEWGS